jgi:hypothetical protein
VGAGAHAATTTRNSTSASDNVRFESIGNLLLVC